MFDGFKKFIFRGNVVDLSVGVIIGVAFAAVVSSLTADVITPIIGMFGGQPDFSAIQAGPIMIGKFINALIAFLITAFAIYIMIVLPMNKLNEIRKAREAANLPPAEPEAAPADIQLLTEIRDLLKSK